MRRIRALVVAGERAARSWACVGCGARGGGGAGVEVEGLVDVGAEEGGAAVREGAMVN